MPKKPFVFNDEKIKNSYGFSIPSKGISLKRFKKNPIMLDSHWNSTNSVLGKWENIKLENGILTGEPIFDSDDKDVAKIEGKVERGFIKSCSMGIMFNREDLKLIAGVLVLEKCELYEVSIVAVPSNSNSIRLYVDGAKEALTDAEVQNLCLSLIPVEDAVDLTLENKQNPKENMKIKLTAAAALILGISADTEQDSAELSAKIVALNAKKTAAELKLTAKLNDEETAKLAALNLQVDEAVKTGQVAADKKAEFVNLGIANPELLTSTLAAIPKKKSLAAIVTNADGTVAVKTADDFQKLTLEAQLEFKKTKPEEYQKLFTTKN